MNRFTEATQKRPAKAELTGRKRREKALREFKEVLHDLVLMLRKAAQVETAYFYWVNRDRRQFVLETKATVLSNVVFQDRLQFEGHFLEAYKDISQAVTLKAGKDIEAELLSHYQGNSLPVNYITLLPFTNNEETVAITVLEAKNKASSEEQSEVVHAYTNALGNVFNTYLEISDLQENQQEWVDYENSLNFIEQPGHPAELLNGMMQTLQTLAGEGSVSLIANGMEQWSTVMNSTFSQRPLPVGMPVEERTVAWNALESGEPEFAIHFNKNPKRVSPRELYTQGATLAIPIKFNEHRKGVVLVYEQNPLVFKESTKHKLINAVRLTGLKIQARLNKKEDDYLLTNQYGAYIPDLWERTIDTEIQRLKSNSSALHTWIGLVTLADLSEIRTQLRLEDLNLLQKDVVKALNPNRFGIPGIVGYQSDYVYLVMLQSKDSNAAEHWVDQITQQFSRPFEMRNGKQIQSQLRIATTALSAESTDSYQVLSQVRRVLSQKVNAR